MKPQRNRTRDIGFYVLIMVILLAVIYTMLTPQQPQEELTYSEIVDMFKEEQVESFVIEGSTLIITPKGAAETDPDITYDLYDVGLFISQLGSLIDEQHEAGIISEYDYKTGWVAPWWLSMIPYLLIIVAFFALWYYMMNKAGGGGGAPGVGKFGKARTRLGSEEQKKVTFKDVAGCEEEKAELEEVVNFLKNPKSYTDMGARIPKGVLLVGPPGTGKTLLAKAVAGEAGVQFLSISGSDFVELYVGVGASRVRDLFDQAKKVAPAIIFIDEIDAVGRQRGSGLGGGHDEREQTLNQLLVEMDGFTNNEGVIVMAATNRDDILDNALTRPGRFDRRVYIGLPDIRGREAILRVHAKGKPLADDVNLNSIARGTPGFSGADLENLLNEAALMAVSNGKRFITSYEIEEAIRKVQMGPEKKSKVMSERARKLTAYHEGGHAVVSEFLEHTDPVHYITIIPRGPSGGATYFRPKEDLENFHSYSELFEEIVVSLGGRVSERLFLDDISTGASGDIQQATNLARAMVTQFGMSERLGPISYDSSGHSIFIGRDFGTTKSYSEETAAIIDEEVKRIFDEANVRCEAILREHADTLKGVAEYLLQNESMDGEDFSYFCRHGELPPKKPEPKMRDSSIEPPARKISYTFDEPAETPAIEGETQPEAESKPDSEPESKPGAETEPKPEGENKE